MKTIQIALLLLTISIYGQDSLKNYNLGEVVVNSEQNNLVSVSSIFDVNTNKIDLDDGCNITSSLKNFPGMYISTSSKNESKILMRGYDQRQVTVFLDGVPIYEPYSGTVDLSNLPKSSIEKIKVSKGMPSLSYGSNSMGGTINFITKDKLEKIAMLKLESGSTTATTVGLNGSHENLYFNVNAAYSKSNGFQIAKMNDNHKNEDGGKRNNSDYENIGGMLKVGIDDFHDFNLAYSFMLINNIKGIPTDVYTSKPRYWRYSEWNKTINNLMFSTNFGSSFRIKGNVYYENFYNVLDSYDNDSFTTQDMKYAFHSTYDDHSFGINLLGDIDAVHFGITRMSFSWRKDVHKEEGNFNQGFSTYEASLFSTGIEQDITLSERLKGIVGLSYDLLTPYFANENGLRSSDNSQNYFAGLSYKVSNDLLFHLNTSKRNRFPTLKEFYSETVGRDIANPKLEVENGVNGEIGITYMMNSAISMQSNLFYSSIENLIQQIFLDGGFRQYQNIGKAEMKGAELGLTIDINNFNMNLNYTYLSAKNKSDNSESEIIEHRPEHVMALLFNYQTELGPELSADFFYLANNYGVNSDTREFVKMKNYLLTNMKISHHLFNNYTLYFRVNNIFNTYYETEYGFPMAGREYFVGLKCNW
jgi:iron complex outermembrane recepter protein